MLRKVLVGISLLMSADAALAAPGSYLCIADRTTGFTFKDGSWKPGNFNPGMKVLLKQQNDSEWRMIILGQAGSNLCTIQTDVTSKHEEIVCISSLYTSVTLKMDKMTLRFLFSSLAGYYDGKDNDNSDTPLISMGRCSPL